jgi:hypothetical protein
MVVQCCHVCARSERAIESVCKRESVCVFIYIYKRIHGYDCNMQENLVVLLY